jgi:hypothetical protein
VGRRALDESRLESYGAAVPDPAKLLNTVRKAIEYTRTTPGRRGKVVNIFDAAEVLATGDLHGNVANFQRILKSAELERNPRRHLVMQELIHGNFHHADGSDKSHQAVDLWCALKCQFSARVHLLPGNHELAQGSNRMIAKGDVDLNANFLDGVRCAYGRFADEIYRAYLELFAAAPLAIRTANRVFLSHSLPPAEGLAGIDTSRLEDENERAAEREPGGLVYNMVWGRDTSAAHVAAFLARVDADLLITGHIPCEQGFAVPNDRQLILDCLGSPAAYCLFPATGPVSHADLINRVKFL